MRSDGLETRLYNQVVVVGGVAVNGEKAKHCMCGSVRRLAGELP
jgi:hypothetical protein